MTRKNKTLDEDNIGALPDEFWERARPAREVLTELMGKKKAEKFLKQRRGRPNKATPKVMTTIRLDANIIKFFKERGTGWQSKINNALNTWIAEHG